MEAERHMFLELNARTLAEETRHEDKWLALNVEFTMRRRFTTM
jgi:hypothetical protein